MRATPPSVRAWAAIDLLRFACALMVVAHHYGAVLPRHPNSLAATLLAGAALPDGAARVTGFGWIGVELFFVISGYVIAASAAGSAPRDFLRRRAQRLLPAAWLCATLSLAAQMLAGGTAGVLVPAWLRSMTFWPLGVAIDPSYWTLGIETAFYLLVAWRLGGGSDPARIERLAWWIGGASAAFWTALILCGASEGDLTIDRLAQLLLLPHGVFFATGMLIEAGHRNGFTRARIAGIAVLGAPALVEIVSHAGRHAADMGLPADFATPIIAFAGGVALIAGCRRLQPLLARWTRPATMLGLMTYPLYLIHQQLGAAIAGPMVRAGLSAEIAFALALATSLAMAWAVVRFGEPPLRAWIGTWRASDRRRTASAA